MTKGRPTLRSPELAENICTLIEQGMSLREICRQENMPGRTFLTTWICDDPDFAARYARACDVRADHILDEMLEIADNATNDWMARNGGDDDAAYQLNGEHIQRSKLRIEARKWALSKMAPKKYGDRLDLNHGGGVSIVLADQVRKL